MQTLKTWVLLLGVLLTLSGCSKEENASTDAPAKVSLQLNWVPEPEFGGFYAAKESGAFVRRKLDVQILSGGPGIPVVPMVEAGRVDFGIASADAVLIARARGADLVAVFVVYQTYPQGIMTHAERGLKSLAEVFQRGTVAMEPGVPYGKFLRSRFGLDKVKVVPYGNSLAPFLNDREFAQQCFITSEPIAARRLGAKPQVFPLAEAGYNPYTGLVITRREAIEKRPAVVKAMVEAIREGWSDYLANPAPANAVMAQANKTMDAQSFAEIAEAQKPFIVSAGSSLGAMEAGRWETLGKQLVELKVIDHAPAAAECFVNVPSD